MESEGAGHCPNIAHCRLLKTKRGSESLNSCTCLTRFEPLASSSIRITQLIKGDLVFNTLIAICISVPDLIVLNASSRREQFEALDD